MVIKTKAVYEILCVKFILDSRIEIVGLCKFIDLLFYDNIELLSKKKKPKKQTL